MSAAPEPMSPEMVRRALRGDTVHAVRAALTGFVIACALIGTIRLAELLWLYKGLPPNLHALIADDVVTTSIRGVSRYSVSTWLMVSVLGPFAILGLFGAEALRAGSRGRRMARMLQQAQPEPATLVQHGTEKTDQNQTVLRASLMFETAEEIPATVFLLGTKPPVEERVHVWRDGSKLVIATASAALEGRVGTPET